MVSTVSMMNQHGSGQATHRYVVTTAYAVTAQNPFLVDASLWTLLLLPPTTAMNKLSTETQRAMSKQERALRLTVF